MTLYKKDLATHLDNGWLDIDTRSLSIEFKTYTPNTDCVTQFKIEFQTTLGLLYAVKSEVCITQIKTNKKIKTNYNSKIHIIILIYIRRMSINELIS